VFLGWTGEAAGREGREMSEEMEWGYVLECRLIRSVCVVMKGREMEERKKRKKARFKC
jgi:hypothetical protein